jgi:hypothetical protein
MIRPIAPLSHSGATVSDELVSAVLAQLEDESVADRIRILANCLASEIMVLTKDEFAQELIRVRFALMRINGVLMSEGRPNHVLLMAQQLVDEQIEVYAPEVED